MHAGCRTGQSPEPPPPCPPALFAFSEPQCLCTLLRELHATLFLTPPPPPLHTNIISNEWTVQTNVAVQVSHLGVAREGSVSRVTLPLWCCLYCVSVHPMDYGYGYGSEFQQFHAPDCMFATSRTCALAGCIFGLLSCQLIPQLAQHGQTAYRHMYKLCFMAYHQNCGLLILRAHVKDQMPFCCTLISLYNLHTAG